MPYVKRSSKNKTSNKMYRKKYSNKKRMLFSKRQVKAIHKIAQNSGELKSKEDLSNNTSSITESSPLSYNLTTMALAQGDGSNERVGDKIRIKDIQYRIRVKPGSLGYDTTNGHVYRLLVIQGSNNDVGGVSNINPLEFFSTQQSNDSKYKILYNKIFRINPDSIETKFHIIKLEGHKFNQVIFDSGATTVSQNEIALRLTPLTTTALQLQADYSVRLRFYDV